MKYNKLKLVNFRNHSVTELDLSKKINLFVGPNNSGKSTLADAMSFLITGKNMRTSRGGQGMDELVTFGESRAMVSADIAELGKVTRSIPHSLQVGNSEESITRQQEMIYAKLKTTEQSILCSIYSGEFLDMEPSAQKNFLFNLMGLRLSNDRIKKEFMEWCLAKPVDRGEKIWEYIVQNSQVDFQENPGEFERIHKDYSSLRRSVKKEVAALEIKAKEVKSNLPDNVTIDHEDTIKAKLLEFKEKRDKMLIDIGNTESNIRLQKRLQDTIDSAKTLPEAPKETKEYITKQIEEYRAKHNELTKKIATKNSEIKSLEAILEKLNTFNGTCPLYTEIKCKMNDAELKGIKESLSASKIKLAEELEPFKSTLETVLKNGEHLRDLLERKTASELAMVNIDKAKEELAKMGPIDMAIHEKMKADVQVISERMTKGQTYLTQILAERNAIKYQIEAKKELDKKKNELEFIEIVIESFGPKGIKSNMLNRAVKPLEAKVNESLNTLSAGKYSINFRIDDEDFNIYVISNGIERRIKHLSASEVLRIGVIMQDAINDLAGTKLLVVDALDMLDDDNKKLFWSLINSIKDKYDSIILMATGLEAKKSTSDDLAVFYLGGKKSNDTDPF